MRNFINKYFRLKLTFDEYDNLKMYILYFIALMIVVNTTINYKTYRHVRTHQIKVTKTSNKNDDVEEKTKTYSLSKSDIIHKPEVLNKGDILAYSSSTDVNNIVNLSPVCILSIKDSIVTYERILKDGNKIDRITYKIFIKHVYNINDEIKSTIKNPSDKLPENFTFKFFPSTYLKLSNYITPKNINPNDTLLLSESFYDGINHKIQKEGVYVMKVEYIVDGIVNAKDIINGNVGKYTINQFRRRVIIIPKHIKEYYYNEYL